MYRDQGPKCQSNFKKKKKSWSDPLHIHAIRTNLIIASTGFYARSYDIGSHEN
jgi:hypothetical protein